MNIIKALGIFLGTSLAIIASPTPVAAALTPFQPTDELPIVRALNPVFDYYMTIASARLDANGEIVLRPLQEEFYKDSYECLQAAGKRNIEFFENPTGLIAYCLPVPVGSGN